MAVAVESPVKSYHAIAELQLVLALFPLTSLDADLVLLSELLYSYPDSSIELNSVYFQTSTQTIDNH
jgi:hypothetical protein